MLLCFEWNITVGISVRFPSVNFRFEIFVIESSVPISVSRRFILHTDKCTHDKCTHDCQR